MVFLVPLVAAKVGRKTYSCETLMNSLPSHAFTFKTDPNYPLT